MANVQLYGKADIHIHTIFSDGLMSPEALVEYVIYHTELDVIAVTDHDTLAGALVAQAYAKHCAERARSIEVIIGSEITSADGDILALFIEQDIPKGLSADDTVEHIHAQGGLAIAAHPFSHAPILIQLDGMKGVGHLIKDVPFDGVEIRNGTPTEFFSNPLAAFHNWRGTKHAVTGGSDTHYITTVGSTHTRFPGKTAADLRQAIEQKQTRAGGRVYSPFLIFNVLYDLMSQRLPVRKLNDDLAHDWLLYNGSKKPKATQVSLT